MGHDVGANGGGHPQLHAGAQGAPATTAAGSPLGRKSRNPNYHEKCYPVLIAKN